MPNTLTCAAPPSQPHIRQHLSAPTAHSRHPALDGQPGQLACDHCGTHFNPRRGSGGSKQRFCSDECRRISNRECQRTRRNASYAGPTTLPAIGQPSRDKAAPRDPAVAALHPWDTGTLDVANCQRTEFVVALNDGDSAGTRVETWPPEVRALIEQRVNRWVEENKSTHTVRAMTIAAPKYDSIQHCVVILHLNPKRTTRA